MQKKEEKVQKIVKRSKVPIISKKHTLVNADLSGEDLSGATMKNVRNLNKAIQCKTIMPWGEENSGC